MRKLSSNLTSRCATWRSASLIQIVPSQFLGGVFGQSVRLCILAADEVEHDGRIIAVELTALITHVHDVEHTTDTDAGTLKGLAARSPLRLLHQLGDALRFLLLIVLLERLVVRLDLAFNYVAADEKVLVLSDDSVFFTWPLASITSCTTWYEVYV